MIGYYSWGSMDRALRHRELGFASSWQPRRHADQRDARTFAAPPQDWKPAGGGPSPTRAMCSAGSSQSLIARPRFARESRGIAGNVSSPISRVPCARKSSSRHTSKGFNLAEAFYLALPSLGWQSVDRRRSILPSLHKDVAHARPNIDRGTIEPTTDLPALFVDRWVESLRIESPGAPRRSLLQVADSACAFDSLATGLGQDGFSKAGRRSPGQRLTYVWTPRAAGRRRRDEAAVEGIPPRGGLEPRT